MDSKVAVLLALAASLAVLVEAHNHNRHSGRPSRHVKRHLEEFLEPPPPPRGPAGPPGPPGGEVRSRRGSMGSTPPGAAPAPPGSPPLSLGERIARWFYAGPNDGPGGPGGAGKTHGNKAPAPPPQPPTMVGLSPPPPPGHHSAPIAPPPDAVPHTAEAMALMEQKPPPPQPPQPQDQHASGTEHHAQGYHGGGGGGYQGNQGGYQQQQQQNYPVLMPQSYLRSTDCNPCNNVPWIPMSRAHATASSNTQQDSYGPPAAGTGEAWGQASDAVPLAHAPIPFPALHKGPLPPVFPAEDFTRVPPEPPAQPVGLRDHLVPPTPEHDSVVFTINEEQRAEPEQAEPSTNDLGHDLGGEGEVKAAPDQLHQGTLHHHHALQHHVSGHAQHNVPHLAAHSHHHVPPPVNAVPEHVPYSAAKGGAGGVELVQSVPVASYLASIEYPMTFIQSPLIEIPVKSVPVPHGLAAPPQPLQQHYQVVAPTPLSSVSQHVDVHQTHAGSLPLQGEHNAAQANQAQLSYGQPNHAPRLADSASAPSAAIQHHNLPPCRHYAALAAAVQANNNHLANQYALHQHHDDAATANSQTSHAYAQELAHFESHKVAPTAAPNNYRLLEDGATASSAASSSWPSTSAAPPTAAWDASAAATVTANGASGFSAPSAPSGPAAPGKGSKKTKQIQIIVPYTIDKESGQVRLHSELMPDELSGAGAESEGVISYTPPPDLPPSAGALPSALEALVQQTARKVPHGASPATSNHQQQHQQPQAQESVVVAELSPTPWHSAASPQQDKAVSATDPFAGLQHILATDLRTLLRNEEDSVDRLRLQKNIDNWTAQEYSSLKATRDTEAQEANPGEVTFNFTSTTASVGTSASSSSSSSASSSASSVHGKLNPSKNIPKEYLTTTPLSVSSTLSTTPAPTAKSTPRRKVTEPTKRPAKIHHVRKNATRDDRKTKNGWTLVDNLVVPGPSSTAATAATPDNHRPSEQTRAPWERLQVSISPLTREKVYVVTPQTPASSEATTPSPTAAASTSAGTTAVATDANKPVNINDLSPFRKWMDVPSTTPSPASPASSSTQHTRPRFSIRPTPGWPKPRPHGFRSTQAQAAATSAASSAATSAATSAASSAATSAAPTAERLASTGSETTPTPVTDKITKSSRATPRGFAVETISGHSKVFTATTSTWSKNKKAVDSDAKKSTTAKPTTASASSRTTRALKLAEDQAEAVTAAPGDALSNHRVDLSDIDAEASASVLHRHVAQLTPLGTAVLKATTTEHPKSFVTPSSSGADDGTTETPIVPGPEIVIVESRREATSATTTATNTVETTEASTTALDASTTASFTTSAVTEATSSRTTRAVKTIGRRPDGSRYILTDEEAKQQNGLAAQRTKLQAVTTPKKYESPPPRPKPQKQAAAEALFRRKPSRRPPHLVMTPDRGSYLWNFSEFSGTSHEDMVEDDVTAIKGAVVELKKESTPVASEAVSTSASSSVTEATSTPPPASSSTPASASTPASFSTPASSSTPTASSTSLTSPPPPSSTSSSAETAASAA